jgi:hypothetical protein
MMSGGGADPVTAGGRRTVRRCRDARPSLPHTLRDVTAPQGATLQMSVTGLGGGDWACTRGPDHWRLHRQPHPQPTARLELDADTSWRLCTRGITPEHSRIDGDQHIATAALQIVSIIWSPPNQRHSESSDI